MTAPFAVTAMVLVQRAFLERLQESTELQDRGVGLYDFVPERAPYPYIHLGDMTETPDNRHSGLGRSTTHTLDIWSQYEGYGQALELLAIVVGLFDHQPLQVPGLHHVSTLFEFSQTLTDPAPPGDIRHVPVRFRTRTEQPS